MNHKEKTIVTANNLVIEEWDHIVYHIPRIGESLRFPTNDGYIIRKVTNIIWGMKDNETLEICV